MTIFFFILGPGSVNTANAAARKEEEQRVQRAAEREGRRTRRRRGKKYAEFEGKWTGLFNDILASEIIADRERQDIRNTHMDGMSSDDEMADHDLTAYKNQLSEF